jgi:DNA primase small subunit
LPSKRFYDDSDRWNQLKEAITPNSAISSQTVKRRKISFEELHSWRMELVFTHCYPRLDVNVSKHQNHLLKSPFCVHPKTGRVCIPIEVDNADDFDPFDVPTVRTLCEEVGEKHRPCTRFI